MRWVKETLPPRPRFKWLLITMRLSINSLAAIARTLVAVGTVRLDSILVAVRAATPRSRTSSAPAGTGGGAGFDAAPAAALPPALAAGAALAGPVSVAVGGAAAVPLAARGAASPVAWGPAGEAVVTDGRVSGW